MKEFSTYSELCSRILARPEDFLSNPSLFKIRCFISGYSFAKNDRFPDGEFYLQFSWWVADRFGVKTSHGWGSIISFEAGSEAGAIEMARQLWHEYLQTNESSSDTSGENCFIEREDITPVKASELFELLQERPALYVGHHSVIGIKSFLDGYEFVLRSAGIERDFMYAQFSIWTANRFRKNESHHWDEIISFMGISENASFELLKELWKEYKLELADQFAEQ